MGRSYLSSLLSLEFLREPVGAGEGLVPREALLGVAWGGDTRDGAGRTGGRDWWQDLRHQHIKASAWKPAGIFPGGGFAPHRECPGAHGRIRAPSHLCPHQTWMPQPNGIPKASPGCPGMPSPYLSPDGLFCGEEEEEMAEVVEDLESAESLLAGQAPCQRTRMGTRSRRLPAPSEGLASHLPHPHPAQAPTSLSCHPEMTSSRTRWGSAHRWVLFTAEAQRKGEMLSVRWAQHPLAGSGEPDSTCPPHRQPSHPRVPPAPRLPP